jgi:hypothetical protein
MVESVVCKVNKNRIIGGRNGKFMVKVVFVHAGLRFGGVVYRVRRSRKAGLGNGRLYGA